MPFITTAEISYLFFFLVEHLLQNINLLNIFVPAGSDFYKFFDFFDASFIEFALSWPNILNIYIEKMNTFDVLLEQSAVV